MLTVTPSDLMFAQSRGRSGFSGRMSVASGLANWAGRAGGSAVGFSGMYSIGSKVKIPTQIVFRNLKIPHLDHLLEFLCIVECLTETHHRDPLSGSVGMMGSNSSLASGGSGGGRASGGAGGAVGGAAGGALGGALGGAAGGGLGGALGGGLGGALGGGAEANTCLACGLVQVRVYSSAKLLSHFKFGCL